MSTGDPFRIIANHPLCPRVHPNRGRRRGSHALPRGPARPLEIFTRHQPRSRSRASRRMGRPQGHRCRRHRRLHPSRLVRRAQAKAGPRRARPLPPARRHRAGGGADAAAGVPHAGAVHARGGNLDHLQEGRPYPQSPSPDLCARFRDRRSHVGTAGAYRQHRLRRPTYSRTRFPRSPGDRARSRSPRLSGAGTYLDAVVRGARIAIRLRLDRRLLRRSRRSHLRGGDRAVLRSGDELAGVVSRPLSSHLQLRCPFAGQARARGHHLRVRARLLRHQARARERPRLRRHGRVLPRGGEVSSRRPSQMRGAALAEGDARPWRPLSGLRPAADDRGRAPGRGARRPQRSAGGAAADRRRGLEPGAAAGDPLRAHRQRHGLARGRARLRPGDRQAGPRALHPAVGAGRGHRPCRLGDPRRSDHTPAQRPCHPRCRL